MCRSFANPESNVSNRGIEQTKKALSVTTNPVREMRVEHGVPEYWVGWHREPKHGSHCSCRVLATIAGGDPSIIDYGYCRQVLQKRWRMTCDHIPEVHRDKTTPKLPSHDLRDPLHALLIANADYSSD